MNATIYQAPVYREWATYEFKAGNRARGEALWNTARELFESSGASTEVERMKDLPT
jgi:hypothetical protein